MNKKSLIFIVGMLLISFIFAISTVIYLYDFKIKENRLYYEAKLKYLQEEIEGVKKVKD
jgi:hypothetical protein